MYASVTTAQGLTSNAISPRQQERGVEWHYMIGEQVTAHPPDSGGLKRMGWLRWWCRQERRPLYRCDDYFWTHARTTLTETPGRCGRKVALFSASITKVPPGLMA